MALNLFNVERAIVGRDISYTSSSSLYPMNRMRLSIPASDRRALLDAVPMLRSWVVVCFDPRVVHANIKDNPIVDRLNRGIYSLVNPMGTIDFVVNGVGIAAYPLSLSLLLVEEKTLTRRYILNYNTTCLTGWDDRKAYINENVCL